MSNPCLSCGACCAFFRASFHWLEATPSGLVPAEMTIRISPQHVAMRGSERLPPRCMALQGDVGRSVHCSIHPLRASPCRDFQASWVDGVHNERCDRARAAHGLPALSPDAYSMTAETPKPVSPALPADVVGAGETACMPGP